MLEPLTLETPPHLSQRPSRGKMKRYLLAESTRNQYFIPRSSESTSTKQVTLPMRRYITLRPTKTSTTEKTTDKTTDDDVNHSTSIGVSEETEQTEEMSTSSDPTTTSDFQTTVSSKKRVHKVIPFKNNSSFIEVNVGVGL
jgi:hypothetical protein